MVFKWGADFGFVLDEPGEEFLWVDGEVAVEVGGGEDRVDFEDSYPTITIPIKYFEERTITLWPHKRSLIRPRDRFKRLRQPHEHFFPIRSGNNLSQFLFLGQLVLSIY